MTRFQLYLLILGFGMCILLFQSGPFNSWLWNIKYDKSEEIENSNNYSSNFKTNPKYIVYDESNKKYKLINDVKKDSSEKKTLPYLQEAESAPPWSYDRFIANMTQIIKSKPNQIQFRSFLMSAFSPLNALPIIPQSDVKRILLFAYFRSGSTFLGDLLQQNWKSFYSFEPLHYMSDGIRIGDEKADEAINLIDNIFRCNYNNETHYIEWVKQLKNQFLFQWNKFLWGVCRFRFATCFDPTFISQSCQRAKVHIMKVARLQMKHLSALLPKITDLNVQIVYLVRDPRGTLYSRKRLSWCTNNCSDINALCEEIRQDMNEFNQLKQLYPSKFTLIRYEDLSTKPYMEAKSLFHKLGIPFSASVKRYIRTHTNATTNSTPNRDPYTTKRNSKNIAYEWMQMLDTNDILQVQHTCSDLLKEFGYKFINNTHLNFNNNEELTRL